MARQPRRAIRMSRCGRRPRQHGGPTISRHIDDRSVRIRGVESDPAAGRFEPDPSRGDTQMTGAEPSIKINPRHADAVVCHPQLCRTSLAGERNHDRTRLSVFDDVGDQLPGSGQQQLVDRGTEVVPPSRGVCSSAESWPRAFTVSTRSRNAGSRPAVSTTAG